MIKSSAHSVKFANLDKRKNLEIFIDEWRRVSGIYIDYFWTNGYKWLDLQGNLQEFSIQKNLLKFPKFLDYNIISVQTFLSARALSSLVTQVAGIIRSSTEKQKKRLHVYRQKKNEGISKKELSNLVKKIRESNPTKPNHLNINPEISSKCCDFKLCSKEFDGFLNLHSITTSKLNIKIPIKFTKHSNMLAQKNGVMMKSFLIRKDRVDIRWEMPEKPKKVVGRTLGADQGLKDVVTFSDGTTTPKCNNHGQTLDSILDKGVRKKKGSKAFAAFQAHRTNFINWSVNQLDLHDVKQVNFEEITNITYKRRTSKKLARWTNTIIRDKMHDVCEEFGVQIVMQSAIYRSQRCSCCGLVRRSNRKGKIYKCKSCGLVIDADVNAAKNHEIALPDIPWNLREAKLNLKGFYWTSSGFFSIDGSELRVPDSKN